MLGLYVHIPFCSAICNYCNFNRGLFDADQKARYVRALLTEITRKGDGSAADTIFFGGGTPSLFEPSEIGAIIDACRTSFALTADAEISLEANPETATRDRLRAFRDAGVNRLSFGVQSFRDDELLRLSRLHSAARAREAFQLAREAGFDNVSLDLMMWLPQQSVSQWLSSVDALIALGPDHASLYLLEIYPNAPLRDAMARSKWSLAPDDDAAGQPGAGDHDRFRHLGFRRRRPGLHGPARQLPVWARRHPDGDPPCPSRSPSSTCGTTAATSPSRPCPRRRCAPVAAAR